MVRNTKYTNSFNIMETSLRLKTVYRIENKKGNGCYTDCVKALEKMDGDHNYNSPFHVGWKEDFPAYYNDYKNYECMEKHLAGFENIVYLKKTYYTANRVGR